MGVAFLFKYTAGIQTVIFFVWITGRFFRSNKTVWFFRNAVFGICFVIPFAIQALILSHLGVWDDFYQWSIQGSGAYISAGSQTISFVKSFVTRFGGFVIATFIIWFGSAVTIVTSRWWKKPEGLDFFLVVWLVF